MLLRSKIEWRGIKLHYIAHPEFSKNNLLVSKALDVARDLGNVPVLIHTGEWDRCHAAVFEGIIKENPDLQFVLAHGRPIDETISVMKSFPNAWTDTAFMCGENINRLKEEGLTKRVMFGSDTPINKLYFKELSTNEYLRKIVTEIKFIDPTILSHTIY